MAFLNKRNTNISVCGKFLDKRTIRNFSWEKKSAQLKRNFIANYCNVLKYWAT